MALLAAAAGIGCAGPAPFSKQTPGLRSLAQEEPYFYVAPERAASAMAETERGTLALRVANLFDSYEAELARAEKQTGSILNRSLTIASVVLPLAGTVGGLVLPSDTAKVVASSAAGATSMLAMVNLFYNPAARSQKAETCAGFMRGAVASLHERWDRSELSSIGESQSEWAVYLAVRSALDVGQQAACPAPESRWPWKRDDEETADAKAAPPLVSEPVPEAPDATGRVPETGSPESDPLDALGTEPPGPPIEP